MITAAQCAKAAKRYENIAIDGDTIYWNEMRPTEGGRSVIVAVTPSGEKRDVIPPPFSSRSRVYEYGGGSFAVQGGILYFVNDKDQEIYVQDGAIRQLTSSKTPFGDLQIASTGILAVTDDFLAWIDKKTGNMRSIASGKDFYSSPTINHDETKIAWISWSHPHMPWDETELWVGDFSSGTISNPHCFAKSASHCQPRWGKDGKLYYISDKSGWWNLYCGGESLRPMEAEFASPQWNLGMSSWDFGLATYSQDGFWHLPPLPGIDFAQIRTTDDFAAFLMATTTSPRSVVRYNFKDKSWKVLSDEAPPPIQKISVAQSIRCPGHAFYYPPAKTDTLPPLLIRVHGGPTSAATAAFDLRTQFWTSRGFAVCDVNYGGSTGFGRTYRNRLLGNWGIVDVADCEAAAQYLIDKKLADPARIAITGSSAGGYTVLRALATSSLFSAGASHYGVSDLAALAKETHKFEKHYLDSLLGPTGYDRSPLHLDIRHPVIFFQGLEDKVVPPSQTQAMHAALKAKGIKTSLFLFPGEQHGFRQAANIATALEEEYKFYLSTFGSYASYKK